MMQSAGSPVLPSVADLDKLLAQLRDDMTHEVRGEVADRLLQLGAAEPHPLLRAAMLERAARLVSDQDPTRAVTLLRESYRLFPDAATGKRLVELAERDAAFDRLNRLGLLVDSLAEIAETAERPAVLLDAVRTHLGQGHGHAALAALERLLLLDPALPEANELREVSNQQIVARDEALTAQRMEIATCSDADRPAVLLAYAHLLLAGDEPLADAVAVLADTADLIASGQTADLALTDVALLWVEVARTMGDVKELTRALWTALRADAGSNRLHLATELAEIPGIDREEPQAALDALTHLTDANPDDLMLKARLETMRAATGGAGAEQALEVIRLRALKERDRVSESVATLALARLAMAQDDHEKAERHFRRVRTLAPHDPEALDFFEHLYRSTGDAKRLLVALSQRLAGAEGKEAVRIALEIAALAEGPLATPERAVEAYQRVLAVQADHPVATAALERLYRDQSQWHALRELLDGEARRLLPHASRSASIADQVVAVLERIAALHDDSGVLPSAEDKLQVYRQLVNVSPKHPQALAAVRTHLRVSGATADLAELLEHAAEVTSDADARCALFDEAAHLMLEVLLDPAGAADLWERALHAKPDRVDLTERWLTALREAGDVGALLEGLETELTRLDPDEDAVRLAELLEETAGLAELAGESGAARQKYTRLIEIRPAYAQALAGLARLSRTEEEIAGLAGLLEALQARTDLPLSSRVAVLELLTQTCAGPLNDLTRAAAVAERLRALAPDSEVAAAIGARALVQSGDLAGLRQVYPSGKAGAEAYVQAVLASATDKTGLDQVRWLEAAATAMDAELGDVDGAATVQVDALQAAELAADAELSVAVAGRLLDLARRAGMVGAERMAVERLADTATGAKRLEFKRLRMELCATSGLWSDAAGHAADLVEELVSAKDWAGALETAERFEAWTERAGEEALLGPRLAAWAEILGLELEDEGGESALVLREATARMWGRAAARAFATSRDAEQARIAVEAALAITPQDRSLLLLREQVGTELGDWATVVDTLERLAGLEQGDAALDTRMRAADLCDLSVGDATRAAELYRQVVDARPESAEAWAGLLSCLRREAAPGRLAAALDGFLQIPGAGRENLARAALERIELAAADDASDLLAPVQRVLESLADHAQVLEDEEPLLAIAFAQLDVECRARDAALMLLPVVRHHNRRDETLRCLEVLAATEADLPEIAVERHVEIADLVERQDPNRAFQALRHAVVATPGRTDLVDRLVALASRTQHDADLDQLLLALVGESDEPGVTKAEDPDVRKHLATLRAERALQSGDGAVATNLYNLLHGLDPANPVPLDALEALYREASDGDGVAFVLEERLQVGGAADDRMATYLRLAAVHGEDRGQPAEAAEALSRAVAEFPEEAGLWSGWLQALRQAGDRNKLVAALQQRMAALVSLDDAEATDELHALRLEAAELLDRPGEDRTQALPLWLSALEVDPADNHAAGRAAETLQALAADGFSDALNLLAARLEHVLEARGDWPQLDALIGARARFATGNRRKQLLERQAFLRERGGADPAGAFSLLREVLCADPSDARILSEIQRIGAGGTSSHPTPLDVAQALAQAADAAEPDVRRVLRQTALTWLTDDASCRDTAKALYQAQLQDNPKDASALEGLDRLSQASGDDRGRLDVLTARVTAASSEPERAALRLQHARLADALGEDAQALADYRALLELDDQDVRREAAAALCDLHDRRNESRELADALVVLRGMTDDAEGRLALSLRAAAVLRQCGEPERARDLLATEVADSPQDTDLHETLGELVEAAGDPAAIADHAHRGWSVVYAQSGHEPSRLRSAEKWLATLALRDVPPQDLWQAVEQVVAAGLRSETLSDQVAALAGADDLSVARAAVDQRIALAVEAHDAGAEAAFRLQRLDRFASDLNAVNEYRALAGLFETALEDPETALAQWTMLLSLTGWTEDTAAELERMGDLVGRPAEVDDLLLTAAHAATDGATRTAGLLRLVERAYGRDDMARMVDLLDEVLASAPDHTEAFAMRGAVLTELEGGRGFDRLASHWRHGVAHCGDPAERSHARLELARLSHEQLGASREAFDLIREQLADATDPEQRADLTRLADVYGTAAHRLDEVHALLADDANLMPTGEARARHLTLVARRCIDDQRPETARRLAEQALDHQAHHADAIAVLDTLCDSGGPLDPSLVARVVESLQVDRPERAAALAQRIVATLELGASRLEWLHRLAAVADAARRRGFELDPVTLLTEIAAAEPHLADNWIALATAAGEDQRSVVIAQLIDTAQASEDPSLRHELLDRAAALALEAQDTETAATCWRMALEAQEGPETRAALRRLLETEKRYAELALDLETHAQTDPAALQGDLLRSAELWLGLAADGTRGLAVLGQLVDLQPQDLALAERRLEVVQVLDATQFPEHLTQLLDLARAVGDRKVLTRWLPFALSVETAGPSATVALLREFAMAGGLLELVPDTVLALQDHTGALTPDDAREVVGWRLSLVNAHDDAQAWAAAKLASLELAASDEDRRATLVELSRHAHSEMAEAFLAIEWGMQAATLRLDNEILGHLNGLATDDDTARTVVAGLTGLLENTSDPEQAAHVAGTAFDLARTWWPAGDELEPLAIAATAATPPRLDAALWLEARAQASGDLGRLADLLETRAARNAGVEPEMAVDAWMQLADVALSLEQTRRAADALDAVLRLQPGQEGALQWRLDLAEHLQEPDVVVRLTDAITSTCDAGEMAAVVARKAVALEALDRAEEALAAWEFVVSVDEADPRALVRVAELLEQLGQSVPARAAYERVARVKGDAASISQLVQATELARAAGDTSGAMDLYARLLAVAPGDAAVWTSLSAALRDPSLAAAAAVRLAEPLRASGHIAQLADLQVAAVAGAPAEAREGATRALAATLADELGDAPRALGLLLQLVPNAADPVEILTESSAIARQHDVIDDWLDGVTDLVAGEEVSNESIEAVVGLAASVALEVGQSSRAADLWQLAWDQDPDSESAREAVLALRREAGDPQRLAADLERALVLGSDANRAALRLELAELKRTALGRPREALRHVVDVLRQYPLHTEAMTVADQLARNPVCADEAQAALEPIYRAAHNTAALVALLQVRLERTSAPAARTAITQELAKLQQSQHDPASALRSLMEGLRADPRPELLPSVEQMATEAGDRDTLAQAYDMMLEGDLPEDERVALLERAADNDMARGAVVPAEEKLRVWSLLRPDAIEPFERLEALLDEAGRWDDLLIVLQQRLEFVTDLSVRGLALHRLAGLARAIGEQDLAIQAYRELSVIAPEDASPLESLVELQRERGANAELADALVLLSGVRQDVRAGVDLLGEAARLYAKVGRSEVAASTYEQVLTVTPDHAEAFSWLVDAAGEDAGKLQRLFSMRAATLPSGPARAIALRQLATASIEIHDGPTACDALERLREEMPEDVALLDELLRTAELHHQWPTFMRAAEVRLADDLPIERRVSLTGQVARVALTELTDQETATQRVAELEVWAPEDPVTLHLKAMLQAHSGDPAEAAAGLERLVGETEDPQTRVSLHQQLVDLYTGALDQLDDAIRQCRQLVALDPRRWSARRRLCDLLTEHGDTAGRAEALRQWLAAMSEAQGQHTLDMQTGQVMVGLFAELGEVLLDLGQTEDALKALRKAQVLGGHTHRVDAPLAKLYEAAGDLTEALALETWLVQHFEDAKDADLAAAHGLRAGLLHEKVGDLTAARDRLKRVLELRPQDDLASLASGRVLLALGDSDRAMRLFDTVSRRAGGAEHDRLRADALVGMARCRAAKQQLDQARTCLQRALELVPDHEDAKAALAQL
jgi:tetratricopeptide (TPR) repeat protein